MNGFSGKNSSNLYTVSASDFSVVLYFFSISF